MVGSWPPRARVEIGADIALGLGQTSSPTGELLAKVEHVLARAHAHGKKAAIFCSEPDTARRMADAGFHMVVVGMDVAWAAGGAAKALASAKGSAPLMP